MISFPHGTSTGPCLPMKPRVITVVLDQGSTTKAYKLDACFVKEVYWITAMPICLYMIYRCKGRME